jgi:transposase
MNRLERRDEARRLHGAGLSTAAVAAALGIHISTVYRLLDPDRRDDRAAANKRKSMVEPKWLPGYSRNAIAAKLGIDKNTAYKWLGAAGRPRNQWD